MNGVLEEGWEFYKVIYKFILKKGLYNLMLSRTNNVKTLSVLLQDLKTANENFSK